MVTQLSITLGFESLTVFGILGMNSVQERDCNQYLTIPDSLNLTSHHSDLEMS